MAEFPSPNDREFDLLKKIVKNTAEGGGGGGGDLLAANNLSDVASAATSRTNLGLGTGNSPTFTGATLSGGTLTGGASGLTAVQTGGPLILGVSGGSSYAVLRGGSSGIYLNQAGANGLFVDSVGTRVNPTGSYAFSASGVDGSKDTALARASAGVVEINNGTAGTLRDLNARQVSLQNAGSTTSLRVFGSDGGVKTELSSNQGYGMHMAVATRLTWGSGTSLDGTRVLGFLPASTTVLELNNGTTPGTLRDLSLRNATATGYVKLAAFTVATLPGSPTAGMTAYVTDSNATSYTLGIGAVVAAGGSTVVPVFYDGTNWRIG